MTKGFYNLTSGMLSQSRRLDVVANNMANVSTSGFKAETYVDTSFEEVLINRIGNKEKDNYTELGATSTYILAPSELSVNFNYGSYDNTGLNLDFAITGDGYFAVETEDGEQYTRAGSFTLDDEGFLTLPGHGRVLDIDEEEIQLPTDNIIADATGTIKNAVDGTVYAQLGVFIFEEPAEDLIKAPSGLFEAQGGPDLAENPKVMWQWVESSNVDMVKEMTQLLTAQRALQSASQVLKIYDGVVNKTATDVGRV